MRLYRKRMYDMWDVEYSAKDDKERLKGLYNTSFVGDEEFAEWYFDHLWKAEQTCYQRGRCNCFCIADVAAVL